MREFELIIDEAFAKGLSPEDNPPTNSQLLKECLGYKCSGGALEAAKILTNPLPSALSLDYVWPYPQLIVGEGYNILIVRDGISGNDTIYMVSDDHQTLTQLFEVSGIIYSPTLMEIADFAEYIFMTNGAIMIYWDARSAVWQRIGDSDIIPSMRTVANFKCQAVGGCILSDWYDCDETFYVWSKIGSMDFTPGNDNEAGYRRCPYGGTVYHTRRLGDAIIGYSSKGITSIFPASSKTLEYGTGATFGFNELGGVGLINRGAVNGSLQRQVFVGSDYILREITSEGSKELGYQRYMKELAGEDIIVSYDDAEGDFYIGNSSKTFLLSKQGMTEVLQHPSAVWKLNGGVHMLPDTVDGDEPYICTEIFDMSYRGSKTVFSIESDASLWVIPGVAGVDWSNDSMNWGTEIYKPINSEGIAFNIVAGHGLRFRLKFGSILENAKISYMKVRYKMTDLRGIRGVYAPPPRGQ